MSAADPQAELAELAGALRAELERRERRGQRRVVVPPAPEPATAASVPRPPGPPARAATGTRTAPAAGGSSPAAQAPAAADLARLAAAVAACQACELCQTRTQTVFADGNGSARVMFVGEAPGADEDAQGVPFVGRAGQLLTDIITKGMQLRREDVYIANVLKCRPPGNRDPQRSEKETCTPYLDRQIELVDPAVIIPLGKHASQHVLKSDLSMGRMRGRVHVVGGRQVVPTYHPAFLLRSPHMKKECWKDIQLAMALLAGK